MLVKGGKKSPLKVWESPIHNESYVAGLDTGEGLMQDYSVCEIFKPRTGFQVAEYVSRDEDPSEFARHSMALCKHFNNALAVIERNNAGLTVLARFLDDYPRYKIWKDEVWHKVNKPDRVIYGWLTQRGNRTHLIFDFKNALRREYLKIRSQFLLDQMMAFVLNVETNKLEHAVGEHDDAIFAAALSWQGFKDQYLNDLEEKTELPTAFTMQDYLKMMRGFDHRGEKRDFVIGRDRQNGEEHTFIIPDGNFFKDYTR